MANESTQREGTSAAEHHRQLTAALERDAADNALRILRGGMAKSLGLRLTEIRPELVGAQMKLEARHLNHNGRVNGGAIMAFADLLGAVGASLHRPRGWRGGTLESKTNFFAAGHGPYIRGVCIPLHIGRTTSVWQTTVQNSEGRTIAIVTQTQMALPAREPSD
jgi:1,4-dihydroxy-2-naphthoyl-CoA hydrolase